jgi:hypothetical protein
MPTRLRILCGVALGLIAALLGTPARAQQAPSRDDSYFAAKLMLGVGGTAGTSGGNVAGLTVNASASDDLEPTYGVGAQLMHPLHRYFVLGGLFAVQSWQSNAGDNANAARNTLLDLSLVPQGRLPITHEIELYLALPLGLSLDFLNEISAYAGALGASVAVSADPAVGFNLGLLFGVRFALAKSFGLLAELGYTRHGFSHDLKGQVSIPVIATAGVSTNIDYTLQQVALNLGVFF